MVAPSVRVRGLWHLALKVRDVQRATAFYTTHFGMRVVWAPDPDNVYLSSGDDNLALHQVDSLAAGGALDHLGFVVGSADEVFAAADRVGAAGVPIEKAARVHRDGSVSFYCRDPEGNVIQVLWLPEAMRG
jgi:catechol 2,3-dioxygenase-like lactoylglutathione lyase family enzyme